MYSDPMFYVQKNRGCFTIRILLLVWAYFRLVVSAVWASVAVLSLPSRMIHAYDESFLKEPEFIVTLMMYPILVLIQFAQIGMLITLIVAGHKKNVTLYQVYYIYSIIDLVVYASLMILNLFFVEFWPVTGIYITNNVMDIIAIRPTVHAEFIVGFAILIDICLEIILLRLLKKQIRELNPELENVSENIPTKNMDKLSQSV